MERSKKQMIIYLQTSEGYQVGIKTHQGKKHLVVPVTMMVEGVHAGSHGPLFHSIDELGKYPQSWDGIPVMIDHPQNTDGENISANSPEVIDSVKNVGRVYNTNVEDTKLKAEAWLDENKLRQTAPLILAKINAREPLEVSLGMFTDEENKTGDWKGETYNAIATNHRPDHLALLPGGQGACSLADGCGLGVNKDKKGGNMERTRKPIVYIPNQIPMDDTEYLQQALEVALQNSCTGTGTDKIISVEGDSFIYEHLTTSGVTTRYKVGFTREDGNNNVSLDFEGKVQVNTAETTLKTMKSLNVEGYSVSEIGDHASAGYKELMDAVQQKLNGMDTNDSMYFLEEIYPDSLVYNVRLRSGGTKMYKQDYSFNSGVVDFTNDPSEVHKKVEYVANTIQRTKFSNNFKEGGQKMPNASNCPNCLKKVNTLIANEGSTWKEADREWLLTQEESVLDRLAPVVKEVEKVIEVNKLTPEQTADLAYLAKQRADRKSEMIQSIQANSSKELWPDAVLNKMDDDNLKRIADSVKKEEVNDYSLMGGNSLEVNNASYKEEVLLPAGMEFETKK